MVGERPIPVVRTATKNSPAPAVNLSLYRGPFRVCRGTAAAAVALRASEWAPALVVLGFTTGFLYYDQRGHGHERIKQTKQRWSAREIPLTHLHTTL
jgi:hypothetical protein